MINLIFYNNEINFSFHTKFCDEENLEAVSNAFAYVDILHGSFEICLKYAEKGEIKEVLVLN